MRAVMRNLPDFSTPAARNSQKLQADDIVFGSRFASLDFAENISYEGIASAIP
jgi:hypothetical protein